MKLTILNKEGKKIKDRETVLFGDSIREDIIRKVVEAEKIWQPYANKFRSGMDRSASGNVGHRRHDWKSDRGRGLSRVPRKIFSRHGTQFTWEAAIVPNVRGGRRAHPPKGSVNLKKINKKEWKKALFSALSYVNNKDSLKDKYDGLKDKEIKIDVPIIVENAFLKLKSKDALEGLKKILGELYDIGIINKKVRAGKGKIRGRRYKKNAGLLMIVGKSEEMDVQGIDIVKSNELTVSDLASNGARLTIFSDKAVEELESFYKGEKAAKDKEDKKEDRKEDKRKVRKDKKNSLKKARVKKDDKSKLEEKGK